MAAPKKPYNSTKKINDDEDDDLDDDDPTPGKKVADDDDDDFDEDIPLDDDLGGFDTGYDPYDDEDDD